MRRAVTFILIVLLLLLQYPLWLGKGGWFKVWDLNRQVEAQQQANRRNQVRNVLLDAEVRDLKQGTEAIEERARSELGMIKQDEIFSRLWSKRPVRRQRCRQRHLLLLLFLALTKTLLLDRLTATEGSGWPDIPWDMCTALNPQIQIPQSACGDPRTW